MTEGQILAELIEREGGFVNDPRDGGGSTKFGITWRTLTAWRRQNGAAPDFVATAADVQALSREEAHDIYQQMFVIEPGFTPANIPFEPLRIQLIDFGINSSPARAIRWLQRVCGLQATGTMNRQTIDFLNREQWHGFERPLNAIVNDALVAARSYMIDRATDLGDVDKKFEEGLESRALGFFLAVPVDPPSPAKPTGAKAT